MRKSIYPSPPDMTNMGAGPLWTGLEEFCLTLGLLWLGVPGTATKNFTASRCPWKLSCACAIEQYGIKLEDTTVFDTWIIDPGTEPGNNKKFIKYELLCTKFKTKL